MFIKVSQTKYLDIHEITMIEKLGSVVVLHTRLKDKKGVKLIITMPFNDENSMNIWLSRFKMIKPIVNIADDREFGSLEL